MGLLLTVVLPMRSLIWRAMVRKACSTLLAFLADVSRKGIPRLSANSYDASVRTCHGALAMTPTLATAYSTTFLSVMSLLLPTSSLLTPSVA